MRSGLIPTINSQNASFEGSIGGHAIGKRLEMDFRCNLSKDGRCIVELRIAQNSLKAFFGPLYVFNRVVDTCNLLSTPGSAHRINRNFISENPAIQFSFNSAQFNWK